MVDRHKGIPSVPLPLPFLHIFTSPDPEGIKTTAAWHYLSFLTKKDGENLKLWEQVSHLNTWGWYDAGFVFTGQLFIVVWCGFAPADGETFQPVAHSVGDFSFFLIFLLDVLTWKLWRRLPPFKHEGVGRLHLVAPKQTDVMTWLSK